MKVFGATKILLAGVAVGGAISIAPLPLNLLCAALFLGFWLVRLPRRPPAEKLSHFILVGVALATVLAAIRLPVKQLDGVVAPFHYEQLSIDELCQRLRSDHRVLVSADRRAGTNFIAVFGSDQTMSRREVLEKLARETDCDLKIGYCGTGATILFGAHPSFTRLRTRIVQPSDPAKPSQPIRSVTNRTPAMPGSDH